MDTTTLKGGRSVQVTFEDGSTGEVFVRQIPVRDYDKAFLVSDEEAKLIEVACVKPGGVAEKQDWPLDLSPESYELVVATLQEVNEKGFFTFSARELKKLQAKMASVSPSALRIVLEKASQPSVRGLQPQ